MYIKDMSISDQIEGFFLLRDAFAKTTMSGKPFLSMVLSDCTGTIDAQIWDYTGPVTPKDTGAVVKICGTVSEFKGTVQITVERLRLAESNDQYNISDLVPTAKSVHHSFLNGLLMHTTYMLETADFLAGLYKPVIDRSLLIAGTLLHDFAKCEEFTTSPLGLVTEYSMKGQLLGHLVMGAQEAAKVAADLHVPEEKSVLLQHLILSHHGEPEFGAAVRPMCAEGELLSYIDMIDSRMEIYRETLEEVPAGEFSRRIFALDRRIYHHN